MDLNVYEHNKNGFIGSIDIPTNPMNLNLVDGTIITCENVERYAAYIETLAPKSVMGFPIKIKAVVAQGNTDTKEAAYITIDVEDNKDFSGKIIVGNNEAIISINSEQMDTRPEWVNVPMKDEGFIVTFPEQTRMETVFTILIDGAKSEQTRINWLLG